MKKIAVFLKNQSEVCSFYEANGFTVYEKKGGKWAAAKTVTFSIPALTSPRFVRKELEALPPLIPDCGVIAGGELSGIAFSVFDRAGFHIFVVESVDDNTLNGIWEDMEAQNQILMEAEVSTEKIGPCPTDKEGVYFLDLVELQAKFPTITSKKALIGFFNETVFSELHLTCSHMPSWIKNSGKFKIQARPEGEGIFAVVTPK